jgi:hypothetical protein
MNEREKILVERETYYKQIFVLFEIVKCLKNRELAFLTPKTEERKKSARYLLAFNLDYLKKHFEWIDFNKTLVNMYMSVAKLKDVPVFSYNLAERLNDENYKNFNKEYENFVVGYDLFLDFDGKENPEKCLQEVKEMKKIFDEYKVPYYVMNSSLTGFHFHIPAEYMPSMDIKELLATLNDVIYNLKGVYNLSCLDESVIDMKRICKVPYSIVADGSVCLPLNDFQLESFRPENVKIGNVLRTTMIKNRGLIVRTHNLSEDILKENVKKFISEFE